MSYFLYSSSYVQTNEFIKVPASDKGHKASINCMVSDGGILFTGAEDNTIGIWSPDKVIHQK